MVGPAVGCGGMLHSMPPESHAARLQQCVVWDTDRSLLIAFCRSMHVVTAS
jgi:hypothetical protein